MPFPTSRALLLPLIVAAAAVATAVVASETKKSDEGPAESAPKSSPPQTSAIVQAARRAAPAEGADKVYTNEDLERMFAGLEPKQTRSTPPPSGPDAARGKPSSLPGSAPGDAPAPMDPLSWLQQQTTSAGERQKAQQSAEQRFKDAQRKVAELEKRILAIKNPLMAPPRAPEEGAQEWAKADNVQRLQRSEEELRKAREELAAARAELGR